MTTFEYTFQDPSEPLIVDPFEFGERDDRALAIRVVSPALAEVAARSMLEVRTAVLKDIEAPEDVLARYDPKTEATKQMGYITDAQIGTYYLSAIIGHSGYVSRLAEKDQYDLPITDAALERKFATVGLAKISTSEVGVQLEALDVRPDFARQAIGSLLLYKGFGAFGNHAGVRPPSRQEVAFYGLDSPMQASEPLLVSAKVPELNTQLPPMLEALGMGHDGFEHVGQLREVQSTLFENLVNRGLIEPPESEKS